MEDKDRGCAIASIIIVSILTFVCVGGMITVSEITKAGAMKSPFVARVTPPRPYGDSNPDTIHAKSQAASQAVDDQVHLMYARESTEATRTAHGIQAQQTADAHNLTIEATRTAVQGDRSGKVAAALVIPTLVIFAGIVTILIIVGAVALVIKNAFSAFSSE